MKTWQKVMVVAGCAINGGLGGAILVQWGPTQIFGGVIAVIALAVGTFTGISIAKGE